MINDNPLERLTFYEQNQFYFAHIQLLLLKLRQKSHFSIFALIKQILFYRFANAAKVLQFELQRHNFLFSKYFHPLFIVHCSLFILHFSFVRNFPKALYFSYLFLYNSTFSSSGKYSLSKPLPIAFIASSTFS